MLFFARCVVYVLGLLPEQWRISRELQLVLGYDNCKKRVVAWHRAELEKLDSDFAFQQAGVRLTLARVKAAAAGISPLDPRYPDFRGIDWNAEARVHSDVFQAYKKTSDVRMERLAEAVKKLPPD